MFQYFVKVVGTRFSYLNKSKIDTNQYSVTENERDLSVGTIGGVPGNFFYWKKRGWWVGWAKMEESERVC